MNPQPISETERTLAASTARLLQASAGTGGALGLGCAAAAVLALLGHPPPAAAGLAAVVLALAPVERVLALRLRFDAGLFDDLARADGPMPGALAALDQALAALRLRAPAGVPRPLLDRTQGARRLLQWHLGCVATQFGALAALLLMLLRGPAMTSVARLTAAAIVGFARLMTGVRALWHGSPQAAPTVYFANHTSHSDFVLLWAALPAGLRRHTRPVAAADYWQGTAVRRFIGQDVFRALLIDRLGQRDAPCPIATMGDSLRAGDSLILFPEGTRNTGDAPLLPLKSGLYHLARAHPGVRLVPVWIENLRRVLPKGSLLPVPLACSVEFGAPLHLQADESRADFLERAGAAMLALRRDVEPA